MPLNLTQNLILESFKMIINQIIIINRKWTKGFIIHHRNNHGVLGTSHRSRDPVSSTRTILMRDRYKGSSLDTINQPRSMRLSWNQYSNPIADKSPILVNLRKGLSTKQSNHKDTAPNKNSRILQSSKNRHTSLEASTIWRTHQISVSTRGSKPTKEIKTVG